MRTVNSITDTKETPKDLSILHQGLQFVKGG